MAVGGGSGAAPDLTRRIREPVASVRLPDGASYECGLSGLRPDAVVAAAPWRQVRWVRGQEHFPGFYWSATTGSHVMYESLLELARLLIADHSRWIVHIAAQSFRVRALVDGAVRQHVPDFFLLHADGSVTVVNVKPAERLADPKVAFSLGWAERVFVAHGWRHEIWSGADPVYLENLRFLSAFRRPDRVPEDVSEAVWTVCRDGTSIADVVALEADGRG